MRWTIRRSAESAPASSPEEWRTALKAAFFVGGKEGEEVFKWAAGSRNPELRTTVAYSLYFLWLRDPAKVASILDALARSIGRFPVGRTSRLLRTLADTSTTIYINHPERPDVARWTSEFWAYVLKGRLRLHRRRRWLEPAVIPLLSAVFSRRILETALLGQDPRLFFGARDGQRAHFARAVPLVDRASPLDGPGARDDLVALFESRIRLHNVVASLAVVVHAVHDLEATEPLIRDLHGRMDGHGRLWLLQAFAILLPETPPSWIPLLEDLTRHLVERDNETFMTRDAGDLDDFDIALLPLGLAYAKPVDVDGMPYLDAVLARSSERHDRQVLSRVVEGLAPVAYHHPDVLFRSLRPVMPVMLEDRATRWSLVSTLADVRNVWFDEVDLFLRSAGADTELCQEVASTTDPGRTRRLISWVGSYNNAVHQSLHYPKMRKTVLLGALEMLATASSPGEFVKRYTPAVLDFLHESDFELLQWTQPEEP